MAGGFIDWNYRFQRAHTLGETIVGVWVRGKQSQDTVGGSSPSGSCVRLVLGTQRLVPGVSFGSEPKIWEWRAAIKPPSPPGECPTGNSVLLALVDPPRCWALEFDRLYSLKPQWEF